MTVTLSHYAFAALTAFTWMLIAFYPPWLVVNPADGSKPLQKQFVGYASIWEPPANEILRGGTAEVDLPRLMAEEAGVLLPIVLLWFCSRPFRIAMETAEAQENKYHGPKANQGLSRGLRTVLILVAVGCIGSALALLLPYVHL